MDHTQPILGNPACKIGFIILEHWCLVKFVTARGYANFQRIELLKLKKALLCVRCAHSMWIFHSVTAFLNIEILCLSCYQE